MNVAGPLVRIKSSEAARRYDAVRVCVIIMLETTIVSENLSEVHQLLTMLLAQRLISL